MIQQTEVGQRWWPYWKKFKFFFFAFFDILSISKHNLDTFDFSKWLTPWRPSWIGGHLEKIKKIFFCIFGLKTLSKGLFCKFLKFQDGGHWYLGPSGRCAAAKRSSYRPEKTSFFRKVLFSVAFVTARKNKVFRKVLFSAEFGFFRSFSPLFELAHFFWRNHCAKITKILHIVPKSLLQIKFEFRDCRSTPLAAILENPIFFLNWTPYRRCQESIFKSDPFKYIFLITSRIQHV